MSDESREYPAVNSTKAKTKSFAAALNYEAVDMRQGWPQAARDACRQIWDLMHASPLENVDEAGKEVESRFDDLINALVEQRDGLVGASQLDSDIRELQQLKRDVLENWPWSSLELPPVNVEMLNASMAAFAAGEKGQRIEVLIRQLSSEIAFEKRRTG